LLGHKNQILSHSLFHSIAKKHSISVEVVSLSWAVQRGITVIPKSSKESRIAENIKTVTLTDAEMSSMDEAHNTIGELRVMDHNSGIPGKANDGTKTIMGWSIVDFGLEDKNGQWLS
jgi:glycerol 2-dehydrogenase (NADP+)